MWERHGSGAKNKIKDSANQFCNTNKMFLTQNLMVEKSLELRPEKSLNEELYLN